jgi:hypothetical protein
MKMHSLNKFTRHRLYFPGGSEHQGDVMMKFFVRALGPVLLSLAFASAALADSIEIPSSNFLYYSFIGEDKIAYNLPVAPYPSTATIDGNAVPSIYLICLDINNPTNPGQTYSGTFYTAETISEVNGQASLFINKEVSWLADQLAGYSENGPVSYTGPISLAIWQLEFPSSTNSENKSDPVDPAAQIWISEAEAAVRNGYQPDSAFFIPDNSTSQRFVAISETSTPGTLGLLPAPEPGTMGMMGAGLLGLAWMLRRRLALA